MTETQEGFTEILAASRQAADAYDAFVNRLENQLKYLDLDLSDEAIAQLQNSEHDLPENASALKQSLAALKVSMRGYIAALS